MDEHSASALQYGHLGKAVYHPETQIWEFSRTLASPPRIIFAEATKTTITSPLTAPQSSQIENKSLVSKVYPELAACWPLVNNETLSHTVTTTSEICDPLVSSLLDLGYAVDLENDESGSRTVPIAVVASGECGNAISLYKLDEDWVDLKLGTTVPMRVPSIEETGSAEWSARGAPVRQICFARTVEEKPTWMAARFPHSTLVFRPLYHRRPMPAHTCHKSNQMLPSSSRATRLDANPLVEISNSQTGGSAHAAVTFNPWYQKQIGIVDERGSWSIWEISGRHRQNKGNWTVARVKSGALPWLDFGDSHDIDGYPRHDGWAAIEWVGDVNSLIVSDRRCPMLYRTEDDQACPYPIELGLKKSSEWILDVKRSSCNVSNIFILTTSRVFWLDVNTDFVVAAKDGKKPSLFPRLSWRHFRDPEDTTLRLAHLSIYEDLYLVLYSRLSHVALTFHCPAVSTSHEDIEPMPDPFVLDIPLGSEYNVECQPSLARFSSLVFRSIMHLPSTAGIRDCDPGVKLIKLFMLDSRLSVHESIYVGPSDNGASGRQDVENNIIRLKRRYGTTRQRQLHSSQSYGDFIVDDCDESVVSPGTPTLPDTGISNITPLAISQWAIDFSQVYEVAIGRLMVSPGGDPGQRHEKGFQESLEELKRKIPASPASQAASQTLLEILGHSSSLDDVDQIAQDVEDLLSALLTDNTCTHRHQQLVMQLPGHLNLRSTKPIQSTESSRSGLIEIYDQSVNDWLTLSHNIPIRARITKEKIIRNVATDFALARVAAHRINYESNGTNSQSSNQREGALPSSSEFTSEFRSGKLALFPSAIPGEGGWSSFATEDRGTSDENSGFLNSTLAAFTDFDGERKRFVSPNVTNILQHWLPGTDPATYDWQRTVQALELEESQWDTKDMTPKRRLKKKKVDSFAPRPATSAAPTVREWGSQPEINEQPMVRLQSSQVIEDDLPMTQVERGAFGGREAGRKSTVKAKKKKRAAGF
ncbi:RNA polymerase I-specific transcription initiation factor RRN6-like protein [Aspergillus pseudocaelatus]|uniref:RNA polymerase I-specific transcription initiation factor RRN6-like protein n=1 Tax=Aspergillus pseudocaelatus TaxID=1825620 RepID=A0ABQ6W9X7_9EURO|nr:RNA polymerase I-specific transcription initiation factor RRN6-like protein [Aspergillus pseudocaelatus]